MPCYICSIDPDSIVAENNLAIATRDAFPVSPGHTLVITKRHVETWFDNRNRARHRLNRARHRFADF